MTAVSDIVGGNSAAAITFDDRAAPPRSSRSLRRSRRFAAPLIYDASAARSRPSIAPADV